MPIFHDCNYVRFRALQVLFPSETFSGANSSQASRNTRLRISALLSSLDYQSSMSSAEIGSKSLSSSDVKCSSSAEVKCSSVPRSARTRESHPHRGLCSFAMKASDDEISDDGSLAELAYCCDVHALLLEVHSTYASLNLRLVESGSSRGSG
jgi:hypothetical protein